MARGANAHSGDRARTRLRSAARPRRAGGGLIHDLDRILRSELRAIWAQELREQPPATLGRDVLALGIAYARQERRQGGLSKPVAKELTRLFDQVLHGDRTETPRALTTPLPRSATILVREWQGTAPHATVVDDPFLCTARPHPTLSAV